VSKFVYYNIALSILAYGVFFLYKINFLLAIVGGLVMIFLFIKITQKLFNK